MTKTQATGIGSLYIVATPIGNRDDITLGALSVLKSVDYILAEDTRHSSPLLSSLGIKNSLVSLHAFNEEQKSKHVVEDLLTGKSIALISDAGTPLISDPGFPLVRLARCHEIPVVTIPGPCALIAALSISGVPCDSFLFSGFLPAKKQSRITKLTSLISEEHSLVFYESTHRIAECIDDIIDVFGAEADLVLAKELTKTFETVIHAPANEIKTWLMQDPGHIKGEFVVIIPPTPKQSKTAAHSELLSILLAELPLKQAVSIACKITQAHKNEMYQLALEIKGN